MYQVTNNILHVTNSEREREKKEEQFIQKHISTIALLVTKPKQKRYSINSENTQTLQRGNTKR